MYGRKSVGGGYNPTTKRPQIGQNTPIDDDEICKEPKVDTIFTTPDGSTFAFKGRKYYKLTENAIAPGYPRQISDGWPGLPGIGILVIIISVEC